MPPPHHGQRGQQEIEQRARQGGRPGKKPVIGEAADQRSDGLGEQRTDAQAAGHKADGQAGRCKENDRELDPLDEFLRGHPDTGQKHDPGHQGQNPLAAEAGQMGGQQQNDDSGHWLRREGPA